jgi:hypothetical protein
LPANKDNRGGALHRQKIVKAEALLEGIKKSGAKGELASANLAQWQDYAEEKTPTQADLKNTDRLLLHALGRDVHLQLLPSKRELREIFDDSKRKSPKSPGKGQINPVVEPSLLRSGEVQARTGFKDVLLLLTYVVIVCNDNYEHIQMTSTALTWFEEWFLYLKF